MDSIFLLHFVDDHRGYFFQMIRASPLAQEPRDSTLKAAYRLIRETKCCGIDDPRRMTSDERDFFQLSWLYGNCRNQFGGQSMSRSQ